MSLLFAVDVAVDSPFDDDDTAGGGGGGGGKLLALPRHAAVWFSWESAELPKLPDWPNVWVS